MGLASIVTLAIFTLLWKDNPYFKFVEHITIGGSVAHIVLIGVQAIRSTAIAPILDGKILLIVPLFIGILYIGRVTPWKWTARYPIAILVGVGIGIMLGKALQSQIITQLQDVGQSIYQSTTPFAFFSASLSALCTIAALTYFIFTKEHTGILGRVSRAGRVVLMAGFGLGWGCEVGWFLTCLATRMEELIKLIKMLI